MIVRELDPPYREERIQIVLQALDVPWLKERGPLTIRDDRVYVGDVVVAIIEDENAKVIARLKYRRASPYGYEFIVDSDTFRPKKDGQ